MTGEFGTALLAGHLHPLKLQSDMLFVRKTSGNRLRLADVKSPVRQELPKENRPRNGVVIVPGSALCMGYKCVLCRLPGCLYHVEYRVVCHVEVVGIDTFGYEGVSVEVFDLFGAVQFHEYEVGV